MRQAPYFDAAARAPPKFHEPLRNRDPIFEILTHLPPECASSPSPHPKLSLLFHATRRLAVRERLLERVALRVRVGDAVRLRVRVLVGDALAAR